MNLPPNTAIRFWVKYADGTTSATTSLTMPTLPAASSDLSPPVANTLTLVKDPATGVSTASVLATDNIGVASVVFSTNGQQVPVFWDFINWNISAYTDVPLSNGMPGAFKFYQQLPASVSGTSGTLSAVVTDYAGRSTTVSMNANF